MDKERQEASKEPRARPSAEVATTDTRRPYAPPIVESGDAFERVQLQSGIGDADPIDCP